MTKVPLYKTTKDLKIVGFYNCQRPSAAACKAFTSLRRKDNSLTRETIQVTTEGRSASVNYDVSYESVDDVFFGKIMMPVAKKSGEISVITDVEIKKD
jgi:hypothetical protein